MSSPFNAIFSRFKVVSPTLNTLKPISGSFDLLKYNLYQSKYQGLQKNIEEWEQERRKLIIEEQEAIKIDMTFFVKSNCLLNFCKDCHNTFLKGNAEQKRKIVKIVCSNFSYDGEKLLIEPNPVFKLLIKNSLDNKKLHPPEDAGNFCK